MTIKIVKPEDDVPIDRKEEIFRHMRRRIDEAIEQGVEIDSAVFCLIGQRNGELVDSVGWDIDETREPNTTVVYAGATITKTGLT